MNEEVAYRGLTLIAQPFDTERGWDEHVVIRATTGDATYELQTTGPATYQSREEAVRHAVRYGRLAIDALYSRV